MVGRSAGARIATGATRVRSNGSFSVPGFFPGSFGNGFGGNLGVEALIDPATQWRVALAERLGRFRGTFGASGYYLLNGGYISPYDTDDSEPAPYGPPPAPGQANQPIIVMQQPAAPPDSSPSAAVAQENAPALPDVGQFTLVLRNGAKIQAIGFTRMGDKIVYITAEGSRRTMAVADLDAGATRQVNEERGTALQLPL
jgi:hypothetical protein